MTLPTYLRGHRLASLIRLIDEDVRVEIAVWYRVRSVCLKFAGMNLKFPGTSKGFESYEFEGTTEVVNVPQEVELLVDVEI